MGKKRGPYGLPKYDREYYYMSNLKLDTKSDIRKAVKEYERLRKSMIRQLKKANRAGVGDEVFYKNQKAFVYTEQSMQNPDLYMIRNGLAQLGSFHFSEWRDPQVYIADRDSRIEKLQKHGYDVDESNIKQFGNYMDTLRESAKKRKVKSDIVAKLFSEAERLKISPETLKRNLTWYKNHIEDVKSFDFKGKKDVYSAETIKRYIQRSKRNSS